MHQRVQGELAVMRRTFFQRFGTQGICVLPSDVLSNDILRLDPETHMIPPTLRKQASVLGVCYARVLRSFADGLYWAEVAATPDLVEVQRVLLTEEQLYHALPWDIRLQDRSPEALRDLMFAHAQTVRPVQRQATLEQADTTSLVSAALTPTPVLPLEALADATVEVTKDELQEALAPHSPDETGEDLFELIAGKVKRLSFTQRVGSFMMQQAFLRVMIDALMAQLYQTQGHLAALSLQGRCAILAQVQRWHRVTRQRVVNATPVWSEERQRVVWQLTAGVPVAAYAAA
jgi:hypothetical protein